MQLKFPNARLYIHTLLSAERLTGAQAIIRGACHYGLVDAADSLEILPPSEAATCPCMEAVKNVIRKHFEARSSKVLVEKVWQAIEQEALELHKLHDCQKFAPVLFDLLLQQVNRY